MKRKGSDKLIVALDLSLAQLPRFLAKAGSSLRLFKIGSRLFTEAGPEVARRLRRQGGEIFLDLKFHDIPQTVAESCRNAVGLQVWGMTIHASGGFEMMRRAAEAVREEAGRRNVRRPLLFGVTVLTSMDEKELGAVGLRANPRQQVRRLARLAQRAGLDGVVASGREIALVRRACGRRFKIVVPGIRPLGSARGDQKRVMGPAQAVRLGADYLVVGRPILEAKDPAAATRQILRQI